MVRFRVGSAHHAVDPVRPDEQIALAQAFRVIDLCAKLQIDARLPAVGVQHLQQRQPGDSGKRTTIYADSLVPMHNREVVPRLQIFPQILRRRRIGFFQKTLRPSGKHHAPAVGCTRRILLDTRTCQSGCLRLSSSAR